MNPLEEKIYYPLAKLRTVVFRPANRFFTALHVNADMLSYFGVLLMVMFVAVAPTHAVAGFWLIVGRMFADIMDGPLARYQKTDSDRGKFVDVLMDNLGFALFVFGVIRAGWLDGFIGSIFLFLTALVVVLMIIRYNLKHKSRWYFYASAGSLPYNFVYATYILYAFYAFGGNNYLNGAAVIFSIILGLKALVDYWSVQKLHTKV